MVRSLGIRNPQQSSYDSETGTLERHQSASAPVQLAGKNSNLNAE
jgi:hypothetical protein